MAFCQWLRILVHLFVCLQIHLIWDYFHFVKKLSLISLPIMLVSIPNHSFTIYRFLIPSAERKPFIIKGLEEKDKFPVAELSLLSSLQFQNKLPDSCQDGCFSFDQRPKWCLTSSLWTGVTWLLPQQSVTCEEPISIHQQGSALHELCNQKYNIM